VPGVSHFTATSLACRVGRVERFPRAAGEPSLPSRSLTGLASPRRSVCAPEVIDPLPGTVIEGPPPAPGTCRVAAALVAGYTSGKSDLLFKCRASP
jgi:hypothetical protein